MALAQIIELTSGRARIHIYGVHVFNFWKCRVSMSVPGCSRHVTDVWVIISEKRGWEGNGVAGTTGLSRGATEARNGPVGHSGGLGLLQGARLQGEPWNLQRWGKLWGSWVGKEIDACISLGQPWAAVMCTKAWKMGGRDPDRKRRRVLCAQANNELNEEHQRHRNTMGPRWHV